jgi:hypothetical protein
MRTFLSLFVSALLSAASWAQTGSRIKEAQPVRPAEPGPARPGAVEAKPALATGIKNVGVGLGKIPSGDTMTLDISPQGAITGRLQKLRTPGSTIAFRDAANQLIREAPLAPDGTFRMSLDPAAVARIATACLQAPGAAPLCSDPGAAGKAITKAGNNGGL